MFWFVFICFYAHLWFGSWNVIFKIIVIIIYFMFKKKYCADHISIHNTLFPLSQDFFVIYKKKPDCITSVLLLDMNWRQKWKRDSCETVWKWKIIKAFINSSDEIIEKIKEAGFKIAMQKEVHLTKEQAEEFYKEHQGQEYFEELTDRMSRYGISYFRRICWCNSQTLTKFL